MEPTKTAPPIEELRRVPALRRLSANEFEPLLAVGEIREYEAGEVLFRAGSDATALYFVLDGTIEVRLPLPGGGYDVVAELGGGSIVGEVALLARTARTATAAAQDRVRAFRAPYERLINDYREGRLYSLAILYGCAQLLALRLDAMNRRVTEMLTPGERNTHFESFKRTILDDWSI